MINNKLELCLITGFLGAGKTTLLRRLLTSETNQPFALFVNDFGEVAIDSKLLQQTPSLTGKVLEFSNGCVCCALSGELLEALKTHVLQYPGISKVFLELSGISNPAQVMKAVFSSPEVAGLVKSVSTVCVIDTKHFEIQKIDSLTLLQAGSADSFYLSKVDLLTNEESAHLAITEILNKINPLASQRIKTSDDALQSSWLFETTSAFVLKENSFFKHSDIRQWSKKWSGEVSTQWVQKLLQSFTYEHPGKIIRMKALLRMQSAIWAVHGVCDLYEKEIIALKDISPDFNENEMVLFAHGPDLDTLVQSIEKHFLVSPNSQRLAPLDQPLVAPDKADLL